MNRVKETIIRLYDLDNKVKQFKIRLQQSTKPVDKYTNSTMLAQAEDKLESGIMKLKLMLEGSITTVIYQEGDKKFKKLYLGTEEEVKSLFDFANIISKKPITILEIYSINTEVLEELY